jgi:hypothetical protein
MMSLRKIPLETFIEILQQLFEEGADFIDINEEESINNKDVIKITARPEYFLHYDDDDDDDIDNGREEHIEADYYYKEENIDDSPLSDKDINDLI